MILIACTKILNPLITNAAKFLQFQIKYFKYFIIYLLKNLITLLSKFIKMSKLI